MSSPPARRRLSSVPRPLGGGEGPESFASFVERVAARQLVPVPISTILKETGVIPEDRHDALPFGYGIDLPLAQQASFAWACRLEPGELEGLLLRGLDGVAFDLSGLDVADRGSVRAVALREWAGFAGSACCPACLGETGGWRLRWKLWTSFACLTHARLLVDRCPRCERRTGGYREDQGNRPRFATHLPMPGRCGNSPAHGALARREGIGPCGQDLTVLPTLDLSGAPRLLEAQRVVSGVLDTRVARVAGQEVPALRYFGHLRSLVALALHAAQPGDLGELPDPVAQALARACGDRDRTREAEAGVRGTRLHPYKAPPRDTRLVAATLPWAVELLAAPDQAALTRGLRPLVERARDIRGKSVRAVGRDFHLEGPLAAALDEALSPRAKFQRSMGHLAPAGTGEYRTFQPAQVPHLIWEEDYRRDFRPLLEGSGIGETAGRVAVSLALVRLTGPHSLPGAVKLLGLAGLFGGASTNPMIGHLARTGRRDAFQQALHALATRLEGPGPHRDYRAAQQALTGFTELDPAVWVSCGAAEPLASAAQRRNAAAWVWAQVLSSHPHFSPALTAPTLQQDSAREVYRRFERQRLPALREPLTACMRQMEEDLGLT